MDENETIKGHYRWLNSREIILPAPASCKKAFGSCTKPQRPLSLRGFCWTPLPGYISFFCSFPNMEKFSWIHPSSRLRSSQNTSCCHPSLRPVKHKCLAQKVQITHYIGSPSWSDSGFIITAMISLQVESREITVASKFLPRVRITVMKERTQFSIQGITTQNISWTLHWL